MIKFDKVSKRFGDCISSDALEFEVKRGSIHGIIGENGAGKSTAMKMLFGLLSPDSGNILIDGKPVHFQGPKDAMALGIGMVHQHFMLAPAMTALENLILGEEPFGFLGKKRTRQWAKERLLELSRVFPNAIDWECKVSELTVAQQQQLEIMKILYRNAEVLILDEPTAVLTPLEVKDFFIKLKELKKSGKTILLITHKLQEIMEIADRVAVFRQGRVVGNYEIASVTKETLAESLVGRKLAEPPARKRIIDPEKARVVFQSQGFGFQVRQGEIVGVAGVEGNGQKELLESISVLSSVAADRHRDGAILDWSIADNFLLGHQRNPKFQTFGVMKKAPLYSEVTKRISALEVAKSPAETLKSLSGGNQQKCVLARAFAHESDFLVAAHPTRGVDIGAIEKIHEEIMRLRAQGKGVLMISSDIDEIKKLSDRVLVLYRGSIVAEFQINQYTELDLSRKMAGLEA